jgi:hypothetical protein
MTDNPIPGLGLSNRQRRQINAVINQLPPCRTPEARAFIAMRSSGVDAPGRLDVEEACDLALERFRIRVSP